MPLKCRQPIINAAGLGGAPRNKYFTVVIIDNLVSSIMSQPSDAAIKYPIRHGTRKCKPCAYHISKIISALFRVSHSVKKLVVICS